MPSRGTTAARACAAGVGLVVAALLTACSGGGSPEPTPPTDAGTVTPEPTPATTPAEPSTAPTSPQRPAEADDHGHDGARATATYFFTLYGYAYQSFDLTAWRELSHPECVFCGSVIDDVERSEQAGESTEGGETSAEVLNTRELDAGSVLVEIRTTQAPWTALDAAGTVIDEMREATVEEASVILVLDEGHWLIRGVEFDD